MKTYEATFIFSSSIKEDVLQKSLELIQSEIAKQSGTIKETKMLGKRQFARQLHKEDAGQYVRIDFQMDPANVNTLLARFKLNEAIFRLQMVAADETTRNYSRRVSQEDLIDGIA